MSYVLSADVFKYWVLDADKGEIRIVRQDGREESAATAPMAHPLPSTIAKIILDWERWWIFCFTTRGHPVISEAFNPQDVDATRGRLSVYLDQNHWRSVAELRVDASKIKTAAEAGAASRVVALAQDLGVILPVSSAHMRETAPLYGDLRYNVGVAIGSLSAGWQMRHPSAVWMMEAIALVADMLSVPVPSYTKRSVVTLEPGALMQQASEVAIEPLDGVPLLLKLLSAPGVVLAMLIDPESVKSVDLDRWAAENQAITDRVSRMEVDRTTRRRAAIEEFWRSNFQIIRDAGAILGVDVEHLYGLDGAVLDGALKRLPMLAYVSGLHAMRYSDRATKWKSNDLTDIMFLACATGYCSYVVAERHTGEQLRSLQRAAKVPVTVHTSLEALRLDLDSVGVRTEEERTSVRSTERLSEGPRISH